MVIARPLRRQVNGYAILGTRLLGVPGSAVPSSGSNFPGYLYDSLTLPADQDVLVRGEIVSVAPTPTYFFAREDSSFDLVGNPATYTITWRGFEEFTDKGTATFDVTVAGADTEVLPGAGSLTFTGYAPTVTQASNQAVNPGAGTLSFTGYAPSIAQAANTVVAPLNGSVTFTGYAPTVAQTSTTDVNPGAGALVFTGYAPVVTQFAASPNLLPGAGTIMFTGYAPTVTQGQPGFGGGGAADYPDKRLSKKRKVNTLAELNALVEVEELPKFEEAAAKVVAKAQTVYTAEDDFDDEEALALLFA